MKIKSKFIDNESGSLLIIYETKRGDLVGEVYADGVYGNGRLCNRATFLAKDKDASEYRVREYFGFLKASVVRTKLIIGDKVKVVIPQFKDLYDGHNVWIIDHIKVQQDNYPSVYVCYNEHDRKKILWNFLLDDFEKIE